MRVRRSKTYKRSYDERGGWYWNDADAPITVRVNAWNTLGIIPEDRQIGPREAITTSNPKHEIIENRYIHSDKIDALESPLFTKSHLN